MNCFGCLSVFHRGWDPRLLLTPASIAHAAAEKPVCTVILTPPPRLTLINSYSDMWYMMLPIVMLLLCGSAYGAHCGVHVYCVSRTHRMSRTRPTTSELGVELYLAVGSIPGVLLCVKRVSTPTPRCSRRTSCGAALMRAPTQGMHFVTRTIRASDRLLTDQGVVVLPLRGPRHPGGG
jgi:hypothetical protein